jgi:predicted RNA-binding protein Jag
MSNNREFYAATVEEAVEKASQALGVPIDQLHFEVLDQGSTGFLGIGARDARIVVENSVTQADVSMPVGEEDRPAQYEGERGAEPQVEGERRLEGTLSAAGDDGIHIVADDGTTRTLAYEDIERANTIFEWGPTPKPGKKPGKASATKKAVHA